MESTATSQKFSEKFSDEENTPHIDHSSTKPPVNYWMYSTFVLALILIIGGGAALRKSSQTAQNPQSSTQEVAMVSASPTPTVAATPEASPTMQVQTKKSPLSTVLEKYCTDKQISISQLPFTLTDTLRNSYKMMSTLNCYPAESPSSRYAMYTRSGVQGNFEGIERSLYFFHNKSQYDGMDNPFRSLDKEQKVTILGKTYTVVVRDPDPFGISTLGVWVYFIGEKKDEATGTIVRSEVFRVFDQPQFIDLVKKYGVKAEGVSEGPIPEYMLDKTKKTQFMKELLELMPDNPSVRSAAQEVDADLAGVQF